MGALKAIALDGVLLAVIAHGLIGLSLVWDKVLLKRQATKNLLSYVFWLGAISVFGLILIPFGYQWPGWRLSGIGFTAGLLDLIASYFYYAALKAGEASEDLAAMGGFTPVATALLAIPILHQAFNGQLSGFLLMTAGGFVMFFAERKRLREMLPRVIAASISFGAANVLQKLVFNQTNFVTGYVFFTVGTTAGSCALLIPPSWRRQIFERSEQAPPRSKLWYMVNRFMAGVGSFLVIYAISRANPAVVGAISGVRYVIIFLGAYGITKLKPSWFKEDFRSPVLAAKLAATSLVIAGLVMAALHGGANGGGPQ